MKIIKKQLITAAFGSGASGYPVDNLLDDHPKKIWKTGSTGQIKLTAPAVEVGASYDQNVQAICLAGLDEVNQIQLTIKNTAETISFYSYITTAGELGEQGNRKHTWLHYWGQLFSGAGPDVVIILDFSTTVTEDCQCGVAVAGETLDFVEPEGITRQIKDYSNVTTLNNGATEISDLDAVQMISGTVRTDADVNTGDCPLVDFSLLTKSHPFPLQLFGDGYSKSLFCRLTRFPKSKLLTTGKAMTSFEVIEVL